MTLRGGIDLGGTKIQALVLDETHAVLGRGRQEAPREGGPEAVVEALVATMQTALKDAGAEANELAGIGVGTPGAVDTVGGTVANARNLPDWIDPFPLAPHLSRALADVPVRLGNDVNVAIAGEYALGAGRGHDSILGVWWGTGVGGGLVLNGEMWHGRGYAGEFGHQVIRRGGDLCGCGNRGCVEAYAGRKMMEAWVHLKKAEGHHTDLFKIMEKRGRDRLTSGVWWRAVRDEDAVALQAIERGLKALGAGIASTVNLLDLPAVIVGGGWASGSSASHGAQLGQYMHENLFRAGDPPALLATELGDDGGAVGASLLIT